MNHMPIDLSLLKSFLAVAESASFLVASEKINKSPSAVSMQIRRLEELLEKELFTRNARETNLTKEGERLVVYARDLLNSELEMRNAFRSEPIVGQVLLGVPDDVIERFPMSVLRDFSNQYPDVAVTIMVDHTPSLLTSVDRYDIDLAIVTYAENIPGIKKAEVIYQEPEIWATLRGGVASTRTPLPIAIWDESWAWFKDAETILQESDTNYRIVLQSENITARRNAIAADFAVGPLPMSQLGENFIPVPQLKDLPPLPSYALGLVLSENATRPVEVFAEHLRSAVNYQTN